MTALDNIYVKVPVWAQHGLVSLYGAYRYWLRFGPGYGQLCNDFQERTTYSTDQWRQWQQRQLRDFLPLVASHVPYYQQHWSATEKDAAHEGELNALPLLNKEAVRADPTQFLRCDLHPRRPQLFHTSGSSGTPVATYWTVPEVRASIALREVRSAAWAGVSFKLPRATFSGRLVEPQANSSGPFYRFNLVERQAYLSAFHIRSDTAPTYVAALKRHQIQWLTGYAVSSFLLARFILDNNLAPLNLKAVVTTSEKVTSKMRAVMEEAYGCPVFEEYGTVENLIFASECEHGSLHVSPDVGIMEILRPDGTPCPPHEVGEVVVTGLMRQYQPFIRYRLGDLAAWDDRNCPCGRALPIIKEVVGRLEDVVYGPDGRQMVRFHGVFIDQPNIVEGQIIQESLEYIRVKVVPTTDFGPRDEQSIVSRVKQRLGAGVTVSVEEVELIPRTASGKLKAVICKISPEQLSNLNIANKL